VPNRDESKLLISVDESGWMSQRAAAKALGVTAQAVNQRVRSGKLRTRPSGEVFFPEVLFHAVVSRARQCMTRAEFDAWLPRFTAERRIEHLEYAIERLLEAMPAAKARKILGDELHAELGSAE
jgi:hypothetical protein